MEDKNGSATRLLDLNSNFTYSSNFPSLDKVLQRETKEKWRKIRSDCYFRF